MKKQLPKISRVERNFSYSFLSFFNDVFYNFCALIKKSLYFDKIYYSIVKFLMSFSKILNYLMIYYFPTKFTKMWWISLLFLYFCWKNHKYFYGCLRKTFSTYKGFREYVWKHPKIMTHSKNPWNLKLTLNIRGGGAR